MPIRSIFWSVKSKSTASFLRLTVLLFAFSIFEGTARPVEVAAETVEPQSVSRSMPGEAEIRALHESYPDRIRAREIRWGEWALKMDERWYYWAEGRLLPVEYRLRPSEFVSIRFYDNYDLSPFTVRSVDEELAARLRERTRRSLTQTDDSIRFNGFLDELYEIRSREDADRIMVRTSFFGLGVRVHPVVVKPLAAVEARVRRAMTADPELRDFVRSIRQAHGYNWRTIAGTQRRSYHSYGTAVDFLPGSFGGDFAYWRWAAEAGVDEWWDLEREDRWIPPQTFIEAFETEGFIWGGKWLFFDTIHFEYRPESILLARQRVHSAPERRRM